LESLIPTLWLLLTVFLAYYASRIIHDPRNALSPPFVVTFILYGIFVFSWFKFDELDRAQFLDTKYYALVLLYLVLCLFSFYVGFGQGLKKSARSDPREKCLNYIPIRVKTFYVMLLAVVGFSAQLYITHRSGGIGAYYSESHGAAGDYQNISGYIHSLPLFLWPALAICIHTLQFRSNRSFELILIGVILFTALAAHTYLFGNRNGVIRATIVFFAVYLFVRRPSFSQTIPTLAVIAFLIPAVLILPEIRSHLHLGSSVSPIDATLDYFSELQQNNFKREVVADQTGEELFFNVAVVKGSMQQNIHDYGAGYIYPILNFVPRGLWNQKPTASEFGVSTFDLARDVIGYVKTGPASNAVAHSYVAFSWFGCIVWAILGYASGTIFSRAMRYPDLMNIGSMIALLIALVFWCTQNFTAFFNAWFFTFMPFWGLRSLGRVLGRDRNGIPQPVRLRP